MSYIRRMYIDQHTDWPHFYWDASAIDAPLGVIHNQRARLLGHMRALGFSFKAEAMMETITQDVLKSTEIEGEFLNPDQVRSSVARRLGMDIPGLVPSDRHVDGTVEMMLDATQKFREELTPERLGEWHSELFPFGKNAVGEIVVGAWRHGSMEVISGPMGRERVHFEAPGAERLSGEMDAFLAWFNHEQKTDPVLMAAIAHIWFITIHPFDDGNGRIARAITDMQLARSDGDGQRFYSMSTQIQRKRNKYYKILEDTQKGDLNITDWILWFLTRMGAALDASEQTLQTILQKARFWEKHEALPLNDRQKRLVNKLLDGFDGNLTSSKWAKIAKCSSDTALRDIQDLMEKGILEKDSAGGRSTHYLLIV